MRLVSWIVCLGLLTALLVIPLSLPTDSNGGVLEPVARWLRALWNPGPLARSHAHLESRCEDCHAQPFRAVPNEKCTSCHKFTSAHHLPLASASPVAVLACSSCHTEHAAAENLAAVADSACLACHEDLRAILGDSHALEVKGFAKDLHPEFRVPLGPPREVADLRKRHKSHFDAVTPYYVGAERNSLLPRKGAGSVDDSGLIFSHRQHVATDLPTSARERVNNRKRLECRDCHVPERGASSMLPVRYQDHCRKCHAFVFEGVAEAPHDDLRSVRKVIFDYPWERLRRRGLELDAEVVSQLTCQEARCDEISRVAFDHLVDTECKRCHEVSGGSATSLGQIRTPKIRRSWFPAARFSHPSHLGVGCVECHARAGGDDPERVSDDGRDILLPVLDDCLACHVDSQSMPPALREQRIVESNCGLCHVFHSPEYGPMALGQGEPAAGG